MAQYGTRHGHAAGKLRAMQVSDDVEIAGVFEPDPEQRAAIEASGGAFAGVHWFEDKREMLDDESIVAIASEGSNAESLDQTEEIVAAGKHVWYDKPAGDDWAQWQRVVAAAEEKGLLIQMGYMLRYHSTFRQVADWARSGFLGRRVRRARPHVHVRGGGGTEADRRHAPGRHILRPWRAHARPGAVDSGSSGEGDFVSA